MSFKENLLKKIKIDKLADYVASTIASPESERKIDKNAMRNFMELSPYTMRRERDLELYLKKNGEDEKKTILVLDNELPIYHTSVDDVVLRKSPVVKEMLNIRNAIKILKDSDVKKSKKEQSLRTVQKESIEQLDLDYDKSDIDEIRSDAEDALQRADSEGVLEALTLFQELLGLSPAPREFKIRGYNLIGRVDQGVGNEILFGPIVLYGMAANDLKLVRQQISSRDKQALEYLHEVANGDQDASLEGNAVFEYLRDAVLGEKSF